MLSSFRFMPSSSVCIASCREASISIVVDSLTLLYLEVRTDVDPARPGGGSRKSLPSFRVTCFRPDWRARWGRDERCRQTSLCKHLCRSCVGPWDRRRLWERRHPKRRNICSDHGVITHRVESRSMEKRERIVGPKRRHRGNRTGQ